MRKLLFYVFITAFFVACTESTLMLDEQVMLEKSENQKCATIQSGQLTDSEGLPIETGYDEWGYNYQAHIFNGFYGNYSRPGELVNEGDRLQMKWNDAWLSNEDCNEDGKLDRHHGFDTYIGSGAWLTNHISGEYEDDGNLCTWNYFVKIVAAPADATTDGGVWFAADGTEIGPVIWGAFAIVQEVLNDPCAGMHGKQYISPDHAGLGGW